MRTQRFIAGKEEIGKTYVHLTIRELYKENGKTGVTMARCECSCGKEVHARATDIKLGRRTSCGHTRRRPKERNWEREEKIAMGNTAAIQRFLTTYRVGGESAETG
jgi:hypothetical protein